MAESSSISHFLSAGVAVVMAMLAVIVPAFAQEKSTGPIVDSPAQERENSLTIRSGYRVDESGWTIAGPNDDPNVISDLEWLDLEIFEAQLENDFYLTDALFLNLLGGYGYLYDGANRDSDYVYDDRRGEFSRSTADTDGYVYDLSAALGYDLEVVSGLVITPMGGYSYHNQHHEDSNGRQEIYNPRLEAQLDGDDPTGLPSSSDLGPFPGLASDYTAEWYGPFVGGRVEFPVTDQLRLRASGKYQWADYRADAYWNLRDLSFENSADAEGYQVGVTLIYEYSPWLDFWLAGNYASFESDAGIQTDPGGPIKLNEATWESWGVSVGISLKY